ncbi:DOMON domain-containing protein / dopamine beta-monooxygenase N-terminal domain-containing protein [Perilla frutescens var. hirtella]|uniref:DOMON domain-containing protein / dopamine beta-monooxygenase N-terminal domain-containing protein n=1 Tax=Perilla frutescens var. hirtella TaxID=608512 RepID=A0AAD4P9U5_PERFH|nr:DOMON domain-containing protein / dopamine beta-monooxygenase N-terminal domain-containing protein [Perilla frutescens var. hirtella]
MAPSTIFHLGLFIFTLLIHFSYSDPGLCCPRTNTSLLNFTSHFTMEQHQLRGIFSIIDDCSFRVSKFDMLAGADVRWWGAVGVDFQNLTSGFPVSDSTLNKTYKNDTFTVRLRKNVTWDQIKLVGIWDIPTASDFGYVLLNDSTNGAPQPTVFDNCKVLSDSYRIRWSLKEGEKEVEIGLEAAIGVEDYMAFGWANESASGSLMVGGDVAITGFDGDGVPFAHDYYITKYSECIIDDDGNAQGVCPDTLYKPTDPVVLVNNTKIIYGHRKDGVSFIRYSRPLQSNDSSYDQKVDPKANMIVIWAIGLIKPPDSLRPFYLPQNHGGSYGHLTLNLSEHVNDCLGPLDAEDKEDQDLVIADKKEPLVVSSGPALHYPNPPNPSKVLYINKKEAPLLRVERGVPVKFSIQAGHNVALYVTSDPIGGNATLRNKSETIYFGGPEAEGVQASPAELVWSPDRNTPDLVYYHSLYVPKMGWKVQVVDGGLPDMYNNSVSLDDQQVMLFWTVSENSISIAARGEKKSGYLAIGFGRGMVNSYAYVGWIDDSGKGRVNTYWIDGNDALSVHPTKENLTYVRCKSENGIITLEFTRPLNPSCDRNARHECNNIIDPTTPLKVIWAMGAQWSDDHLSVRNMHFVTSKRPVSVLLMSGSSEAEEDLRPVLAVHGFMMFLAWGILLPGGTLAARYMKQHVNDDSWFRIHVYLQYSGLSIVFLGFLFAVAELRGLTLNSVHVKFGMVAILLAVAQPINAYFRPKKPDGGEETPSGRLIWVYTHVIIGRCAIVVGIAALISGMKHLGERYGDENVHGLSWALILWFLMGALIVVYLEYREMGRRRDATPGRSSWVLGNGEDESSDLLNQCEPARDKERMEVQLEPLNR